MTNTLIKLSHGKYPIKLSFNILDKEKAKANINLYANMSSAHQLALHVPEDKRSQVQFPFPKLYYNTFSKLKKKKSVYTLEL